MICGIHKINILTENSIVDQTVEILVEKGEFQVKKQQISLRIYEIHKAIYGIHKISHLWLKSTYISLGLRNITTQLQVAAENELFENIRSRAENVQICSKYQGFCPMLEKWALK